MRTGALSLRPPETPFSFQTCSGISTLRLRPSKGRDKKKRVTTKEVINGLYNANRNQRIKNISKVKDDQKSQKIFKKFKQIRMEKR